jgi:hypothetical protein
MHRAAGLCVLLSGWLFLAESARAVVPAGSADPAFSGIHFDQWFDESVQTTMKWTASVSEAQLSTHQRLFSRVEFKVDKEELAHRRGKGRLLLMTQVTDGNGGVWQHHSAVDLEPFTKVGKGGGEPYIQPFFVLPGDYTISLAVVDSGSGEHSVMRRKLHVTGLRNDPLPDAWRDLPAVEFLTPGEPPEIFFLPEIQGRLHLPVKTPHALQVDLLANLTPSERFSGSGRVQEMTMEVLLPSLKVLSGIELAEAESNDATVNLEMLDLARNRVVYRQENMVNFDWEKALEAIKGTTAGIIDVKSLARHRHSADFFVREVGRRVSAPLADGQARAVIVLTSSVSFKGGVELHPLEVRSPNGVKIFYLRYQPLLVQRPRGPAFGALPPPGMLAPPENDQLEPLLRGLNPQLFKFTTPTQFRRALAQVLAQVGSM